MKLRHLFTFVLLSLFPICSRAQVVYMEVGGASTTAGVHFDSRFNDHTRWGGRLGVAYTYSKDSDFFPSGPDKNHRMEHSRCRELSDWWKATLRRIGHRS